MKNDTMYEGNRELILYANVGGDVAVENAVVLFERGNDPAQSGADSPKPADVDTRADSCDGYGGAGAASLHEYWTAVQKAMLAEIGSETIHATYWQNHICALVSSSDNPFSRAAERGAYITLEGFAGSDDATKPESEGLTGNERTVKKTHRHSAPAKIGSQDPLNLLGSATSELAPNDGSLTVCNAIEQALKKLPETDAGLFRLAAAELETIMSIYAYDFRAAPGITAGADNIASLTPAPGDVSGSGCESGNKSGSKAGRERVHEALGEFVRNSGLIAAAKLAVYHRSFGAGALESAGSFFWNGDFMPVGTADPIRLSDLIGVGRQTAALTENIEFLLRGLPASNILLYGDSGTGKSSSVKALLNEYADRGLKLVALPKGRIGELPDVLSAAAGRGLKFIIYVDDLSFEENESTYKSFKSVIEGGVSARPQNVVICVTSNRRNIVKEVWKDRVGADDVNLRDNLQEKRSLADRFGLTIVYESPDKKEFLDIVVGLAKKAGINIEENELRASALTWEVRHGGRSGRTAKQFIDYMTGHLALDEIADKEQEGSKGNI